MDPGELLDFVIEVLTRLEVPHFVTGSTATITYGEPRFTNDIDIVVQLTDADVDPFAKAFDTNDYYLSAESMRLAIQRNGSFNLIHPASGLKVDFMLAADSPFNRSRFARTRTIKTSPDRTTTFSSPEDVILKKLEFYRDGGSQKHVRDIVGVLRTSRGLDFEYLDQWAQQLEVASEWTEIRALTSRNPTND